MKTVITLLSMMVAINCSAALRHTNQNVPDAVQKSFAVQYPQQHARTWDIKNDTCIAVFRMSRSKHLAYYIDNGKWLKTETKIADINDLPKAVSASFHQSEYQSWYIMGMKQVETPDQQVYALRVTRKYIPASYFSEFSSADKDVHSSIYDLYFNSEGALIKKAQLN